MSLRVHWRIFGLREGISEALQYFAARFLSPAAVHAPPPLRAGGHLSLHKTKTAFGLIPRPVGMPFFPALAPQAQVKKRLHAVTVLSATLFVLPAAIFQLVSSATSPLVSWHAPLL